MKATVVKAPKRIRNTSNKTEGVKNYDVDNKYPQRTRDVINSSGTAKRSVETLAKYIRGGGFKDRDFYKAKISGKGLTPDALLRAISEDLAYHGGRAYHISYNGLLQKIEIKPVPFQDCRLGIEEKEGMIAVYDDWACIEKSRINKDKIRWYYKYTSDKNELLEQIDKCGGLANYPGQIYTNEHYPLAPIDSVFEDVLSDFDIKTFTNKELKNGFRPSAIIQLPLQFESDQEREDMQSELSHFQGPENVNKIMLFEGVGEKPYDISKFDAANNDKMYESTNSRVKNSIRQIFGQPPSILGVREGNVTFSSQNIQDDTKFYNSITTDERLLIEEDMKNLFENFYYNVCPSGDFSILELKFDAIATEKPSKISTLGIGGTQAAIALISSDMADNLKIANLQIFFGLTLEEAQQAVLGIKPPTA